MGEEDCAYYVGYLVIASDQKFLIARGEDGDVTGLRTPTRNLLMLKDRRGGLRVLRGLPREASDHKFLIKSGKDGDITELMTPVHTLLRLEDDEARTAASKNRLRHKTTARRYRFDLSFCQRLVLASRSRA